MTVYGGGSGNDVDIVDVGQPACGVREADGVLTRLQLDGKRLRADLAPAAAIGRNGFHLCAVDADGNVTTLAADIADGQLVVAAIVAVDVAPLQAVLLALS